MMTLRALAPQVYVHGGEAVEPGLEMLARNGELSVVPKNTPEFPKAIRIGNRLMFDRHDVENYKRALLGLPALERDPATPIQLVNASQLKSEIGVSRRTVGRKLRAGEAA